MLAPRLRHRIDIQQNTETIIDGDRSYAWTTIHAAVPADFLSGPGREFLAAEAIRAETAGRFVIRYLPGVTAEMRVLWEGLAWNIKAPPIIDATARRDMTLLVGAGVNDG